MTDIVERFDKAALDWGWTQDWGYDSDKIYKSHLEYESAKAALIGEIERMRADIANLTTSLAAEVSESERLRSKIAALRVTASQVRNQALEDAALEVSEYYGGGTAFLIRRIRALKDKADD